MFLPLQGLPIERPDSLNFSEQLLFLSFNPNQLTLQLLCFDCQLGDLFLAGRDLDLEFLPSAVRQFFFFSKSCFGVLQFKLNFG